MRAALDRALGLADRGSRGAALAGGLLILAAAVLVSVDVILRKLLSVTVGGADELSGYALAIGSTWSFAFVLLHRGNVRIDALYQLLPRPLAALCDMLAILSLLVFVSLVAWHGGSVLANSWSVGARSNSSLAVPLAIPQALWWIGYAWFVLCGIVLVLRGAMAFLASDWNDVNRLIGARSIEEEAADELSNAVQSLGAGKP
ncbi:MAG TPA: TRAP transporter small permease subunit [Caldimonas sp.]|nr:TRAP transporter small permease subunit [Caldimonas sp.]HEX2541984.1 TRAP transporter small permease subunit [Caldimonas sp.]